MDGIVGTTIAAQLIWGVVLIDGGHKRSGHISILCALFPYRFSTGLDIENSLTALSASACLDKAMSLSEPVRNF